MTDLPATADPAGIAGLSLEPLDLHESSGAQATAAIESHVGALCAEIDELIEALTATKARLTTGATLIRAHIAEQTAVWRDAALVTSRVQEFLAQTKPREEPR